MTAFVQGWEGYAGVSVGQSVLNTSVAASKFQRIKKASLEEKQEGRAPVEGEIFGGVDPVAALKGRLSVAGSLSGNLNPDEFFQGALWGMILDASNTVTGDATNGYTHAFTDAPANLPLYGSTIEAFLGGSGATTMRDFIGCFCNKVDLTVPEQGAIEITADFLGIKETDGDTKSTPTYANKRPFEGWMADLKIGANLGALTSVTQFKGFKMSIENGITLVPGLNGRYPVGRTRGHRKVNLSFTQDFKDDLTVYNYWKNQSEMAVQLVLTHDQLAGSGGSAFYKMTFNFPRVIFTGKVPNLDNVTAINHEVDMVAIKELTSYNYTVGVTSVNSESAVYAM